MNLELLESDNENLKFVLKESNEAFLNAIRRNALSKVKTLAIEEVDVYENTSAMQDEYLAHRLALIPLKGDLESLAEPDKCCGGKCGKCSVTIELDQQGPKTVYSSDLVFSDPKASVAFEAIPIIKLKSEFQRVRMEIRAVLGSGKEHAKWTPGIVAYSQFPELEMLGKIENTGEIIKSCPKGLLSEGSKGIELKEPQKCDLCNECVEKSEGLIRINKSESDFIVRVESHGSLATKDMLSQSAAILAEEADELQKNLEKK